MTRKGALAWQASPGQCGPVPTFEVAESEAGERLDRYVAARVGVSRRAARLLIAEGRVRLRGKPVRIVSRTVGRGARVEIELSAGAPLAALEPEHAPIGVLHLDRWCVAVNKPAGLLSETDRVGSPSLETEVPKVLRARGERRTEVWLAHRLDAGTSGVLILARTPSAATQLGEAFARGKAEKTYLALCVGRLEKSERVVAPIGRDAGVKHKVSDSGRPAATRLVPVAFSDRASLVHAHPETGRTHQIRVHLAHLGHPIWGDRLYGGPGYTDETPAQAITRPMLHAEELVVPHPKSAEPLRLRAPPPEDLVREAKRLGLWPK